jgi:hypothetical protein
MKEEKHTEFIVLTEMWQDGHYTQVGDVIRKERWGIHIVAEFCSYMAKHLGLNELNILYKFL